MYGADNLCEVPFFVKNSSNSALLKQVPLSVTMVSGIPNWTNTVLRCWTVILDITEFTGKALIHFE